MKLLHFIESKGPAGFQLFLRAIDEVNEVDQHCLRVRVWFGEKGETSDSEPTDSLRIDWSHLSAQLSQQQKKNRMWRLNFKQPDTASTSTKIVHKYPNLIFPTGPLKKKSHTFMYIVYTSLMSMVWDVNESKAHSLVILQ